MLELFGSGKMAVGSSNVCSSLFGAYSVILPLSGSILAILPAASANHITPELSEAISAGPASGVGMSNNENFSLEGSNLVTLLAKPIVIHRFPLWSILRHLGIPPTGITNCLMALVSAILT